jgi:GNAT superfamily N-acetyltransferase
MAWNLTSDCHDFVAAAGGWLRTEPVRHTTLLTVLQTVLDRGPGAFGDQPPQFGWHESQGGETDGAFLRTPPYAMLLAPLPPGAAGPLVEALQARGQVPPAVNLVKPDADAVTAAWQSATGCGTSIGMRTRLYRLGTLLPPDPPPAGRSRRGTAADTDLLISWELAFAAEAGTHAHHVHSAVADVLDRDAVTIWEVDGVAVSMATLSRQVAGAMRVGQVYTPPEQRRRGYGAAVTTAVTQAAFAAGATNVLLFTDLANPTSNGIYQRLGYQPLADWCELTLLPAS